MGTGTKLNKDSAPQVESMPGFEGRYEREDGYVLGFESFDQAGDFTPMYRGLPDDRRYRAGSRASSFLIVPSDRGCGGTIVLTMPVRSGQHTP